VSLINAASCIKANRLEDERKAREWAEVQRRREELRDKREKEQTRLDQLNAQTQSWVAAQQIRSFVGAVKASGPQNAVEVCQGMEMDEWVFWASQQADRLDPLAESPASVLDEKFERYW
jgi:hypothetical protein